MNRALAKAMHGRGFAVAAADLGYTASHQVAVDMGDHGGGGEVSRRLAENGVITNMNLLPGEPRKNARHPRGIRIGVQEMTRFGMGGDQMERIAELIQECVVEDKAIAAECKALREEFPEIRYGFGLSQLELS
jgi:glycine hydroxymethyltransferase